MFCDADGKESACNTGNMETQDMWVQSLGQEDLLKKEMATHSSIPAWRIQRTEEPEGLWGHKELDMTKQLTHTHMEYRKMVSKILCAGQQRIHRHKEQIFGHSGEGEGGMI